MCDLSSKLLNDIKGIYVNSLAYIRVKGGESEFFVINSCARERRIIFLGYPMCT